MTTPINCPYYGKLTAAPCWNCVNYHPDTGQCSLAGITSNDAITGWKAQTYEERLRDYEKRRKELLQLSKEALVDLIIHRPTYY